MNGAVIRLEEVSKSFGSQLVLNRISMDVPRGRTTVIVGGSGQGKSVTLKLILGLMTPDSGRVLVDGEDITRMKKRELDQVRSRFGVLFQGAALLDSLSVFDNVALPLEERTNLGRDEIRDRVMATLEQLGLTGHENKFPAQLSGGMKKRVGLARALQLEPEIMLFDEPTTGLDPEKTMEIYRLFSETRERFGYTAVIVSHDIPKVFNLADQVVVLNHGRVWSFASPEELQLSDDPEIVGFVRSTMGTIYRSGGVE